MTLDEIDIANPDAYLGESRTSSSPSCVERRRCSGTGKRTAPASWHADIARVARDQTTFRRAPALFIEDLPPGNLRDSPDVMINMDPPRHARYRALVTRASPRGSFSVWRAACETW